MEINVGKGITIDADLNKLGLMADAHTVGEHVIRIGLRNILMDSHAGISTDETDYQAKARAIVEKKLEAMYNGEVRVAGTREGDPVRAEAMRLALAKVDQYLRAKGTKPSKVDAKVKREAAQKLLAKDPSIMELARTRVEQAKSAIADDADLTELGL
jgi:hypothetical protein